ncbi:nucleotide disphospho-sugar-binding domain-containing protein [Streptomyces californicus]|uniref:nucleotide disphospho-sugar-binding domain-containing protein n=1 Tax=Streptomyces californicus TaxID=67351 RepID=UPI0036A8058A
MSHVRSHIAVIGVPIVSHVLPGLGIVRELVARGHRVTCANDPAAADRITATGAELVPCDSTLPVADNAWPTDPVAWTRPEGAGTVLLISLGSAYTHRPEFYRRCLAAYGNRPGLHVVLQIGRHTDPRELGVIPPNVEVHSWVPQRAVLEQADAFVTHAGMGGCGDGLRAGVPMIAVPQGAEQFMNADRLVELGVARRIDTPDATAESLWTALNDVLDDPELARRSARLRAEALSEGGTPRAVRLIEEMLEPVEGA